LDAIGEEERTFIVNIETTAIVPCRVVRNENVFAESADRVSCDPHPCAVFAGLVARDRNVVPPLERAIDLDDDPAAVERRRVANHLDGVTECDETLPIPEDPPAIFGGKVVRDDNITGGVERCKVRNTDAATILDLGPVAQDLDAIGEEERRLTVNIETTAIFPC